MVSLPKYNQFQLNISNLTLHKSITFVWLLHVHYGIQDAIIMPILWMYLKPFEGLVVYLCIIFVSMHSILVYLDD